MGKTSTRHISEVGTYGDEREYYASRYVLKHCQPNDPDAVLRALEDFDVRWTMLHLGNEKGIYLDRALREVISEKRTKKITNMTSACCRPTPLRALEIGAYIGYSAIRIGRIIATEAEGGSTLLSVEQNHDNATYARTHLNYAGLGDVVKVLNSNIEKCFDDLSNEAKVPIDEEKTSFPYHDHGPYDFVFIDHRKPFYLRDLKFMESRGYIDATTTTLVADNVASLTHLKNRAESIKRGKRKGPCKCVNKACNYLDYVTTRWSSTEIFYGENSTDGIAVSKPSSSDNVRTYTSY